MNKIIWNKDGSVTIDPPKKPKLITGTKLGAILGVNKWSSPFKVWAEMVRIYKEPYTENRFTSAGNIIEPILINFLRDEYFLNIKTPEDIYGEEHFKITHGHHFDDPIFNGAKDGETDDCIIEIKTTRRPQDWAEDIPEYYKLQGALYAYLQGVDRVLFCCGFLTEKDYNRPYDFVPVLGKNTIIREFKMSEEYPDFEKTHINPALDWWNKHIVTGVSPIIGDCDCDAEVVKELRKETINTPEELTETIATMEELTKILKKYEDDVLKDYKTQLKALQAKVKNYMFTELQGLTDKDSFQINGVENAYKLSKAVKRVFNEDAFVADHGNADKYFTTKETYTLRSVKLK